MRTKNGGGLRKSFYFPSSKGWLFTRGLVKKRVNFVWITGPKSIVRFTFKRISHWECSTGLSCCNWCIDLKFLPFLLQVRQINITSLGSFYESPMFTSNRFIHDKKRKLIIQTLWSFTSRALTLTLALDLNCFGTIPVTHSFWGWLGLYEIVASFLIHAVRVARIWLHLGSS